MIRPCPSCGRENRIPAARLADRASCGNCKQPILPIDEPVEIGSAASFDELIRDSPLPVVIDFWASWCAPCRMVTPELRKLADKQRGRVVIAKVNTERLGEIAGRFGIRSIPTLIRFDQGKETKRTSGAQSAEAFSESLGLGRLAA